jgi:Asp-tRNA(Asn)/Glu-tRNA(Gln) amidotransferase A subunit family amidase
MTNGLPIGMQLIGKVLREDQLFQVAYAYEQSTEWHLPLYIELTYSKNTKYRGRIR